MNTEEGGNRAIYPRQLHRHHAIEQALLARALISLIRQTGNVQPCQPRDELIRKFLAYPIVIDDRGNLGFHEGTNLEEQGLIFLTQGRADLIKISIDPWK